jgi:hypothetical protein
MKLANWLWTSILLGCVAAVPALADDVCSAAKASVEIADLTVGKEGAIDAKGTWAAEGGTEGVLVEYRIDSDRMQSETRMGQSGSWDFARRAAVTRSSSMSSQL